METYRFTTCPSPVGRLTLASDGGNLVGLWLEGQKYFGQPLLPGACVQDGGLAVFRAARQWLDAYFAGEQPCPGALPLRPAGSAFRQQVDVYKRQGPPRRRAPSPRRWNIPARG